MRAEPVEVPTRRPTSSNGRSSTTCSWIASRWDAGQLLQLVGDELGEPRRFGLDGCGRSVEQLENAEPRARASLQRALAHGRSKNVPCDAVEPWSSGSLCLVAKPQPAEPGLRERLGRQVVGSVGVAAAAQVEAVDPPGMSLVELAERSGVARRRSDELCVGQHSSIILMQVTLPFTSTLWSLGNVGERPPRYGCAMQFSKWHALGNSYLVVEQPDAGQLSATRVQRLCSVESGIGSDGVLEVTQRNDAHAVVTIWNPDGSTAEMSGNGVRIAARWLAAESGATEVTIETAGRQVTARMLNALDTDTDVGAFTVGSPESVDGIELTTASVGNPHAVVRLDDPTRDDLLRLGPLIENHPRFPDRTNVQLVRVDGRHDLTVLVWERGAGETSASGTSSVAAAAVAVERGWCDSPVTVHLPGGDLNVRLADGQASLTGPAERIAWGTTIR